MYVLFKLVLCFFLLACHNNCSVPGTLQGCYHDHADSNEDHCCLVYSNSLCSKDCKDEHYSADESFICSYDGNSYESHSIEISMTGNWQIYTIFFD